MGSEASQVLDAVDGRAMRAWVALARLGMDEARAEIDALNVFPVADGDTGTNLALTVRAAAAAVAGLAPEADLAATVRALARGSLLGARGNSGTILSQLLRGIATSLDAAAARQTTAANADLLVDAFRSASDAAYAAVARPVEGTMLSVARGAADAAAAEPRREIGPVVLAAAAGARAALLRTPQQLDVLARAGVVDAGGRGVVVLLDALAALVTGAQAPPADDTAGPVAMTEEALGAYEVMYLLDAPDVAVPGLRATLLGLGSSVVVVGGDGLWSVHLHADDAGGALEAGIAVGRPHRVRISALEGVDARRRVVVAGVAHGLARVLERAGAHVLVAPVAVTPDDLAPAHAAARELVVLCPAGEVARFDPAIRRLRRSGLRAAVLPMRSAVQAVAAVAVHDPARGFEDDVVAMTAAAGHVRWGGLEGGPDLLAVVAGDVVAGEVVGAGDAVELTRTLLGRLLTGRAELVTLLVAEGWEQLEAVVRAQLADGVELTVLSGCPQGWVLMLGVE